MSATPSDGRASLQTSLDDVREYFDVNILIAFIGNCVKLLIMRNYRHPYAENY